ncbi:LysM peptidoglycan-binding domain-containing protein [uncultured Cellulomonas sp.]|uniref:LysM peptidoglycan-binding domain-containing protein n=1 Tax=uncultured Cellulomonas sp. TaxID=189682 RepID=UPI0028EE5053|nr:LysM peptidoglycan-binding domain-containing protein [uncultured Cellulomonas sp.]
MSAMVMGPAVPIRLTSAGTSGARTSRNQRSHGRALAGTPRATETATPRGTDAAPAHLRLTARGRIVLWVLAAVAVALVTLVGTRASADGPLNAQEVERHVVQPGETLWAIAEGVASPSQDVRDVVFDLVRLNELPDAGLMAGQVIVVPAG